MIEGIFTRLRELIARWREEAHERRKRTSVDPGADALTSCANDLHTTLHEIDTSLETVTAEQYAEAIGVTPQTVRNWIRAGELTAEQSPNGYRIARQAQRRKTGTRRAHGGH